MSLLEAYANKNKKAKVNKSFSIDMELSSELEEICNELQINEKEFLSELATKALTKEIKAYKRKKKANKEPIMNSPMTNSNEGVA